MYFPAQVTVRYNREESRTIYTISMFFIRTLVHFPACIDSSGRECCIMPSLMT
jgi:hypothetical protein